MKMTIVDNDLKYSDEDLEMWRSKKTHFTLGDALKNSTK